jgi:hypothetical protein
LRPPPFRFDLDLVRPALKVPSCSLAPNALAAVVHAECTASKVVPSLYAGW